MTQREVKTLLLPLAGRSGTTAHGPWRSLVARVLSATAVCVFMLAAQSARADSFTFSDAPPTPEGTIGVPVSSRLTTSAGCGTGVEICAVSLAAPTGATFNASTIPSIILIDNGSGIVSDELLFAVSQDKTFVTLTFLSDSEAPGGFGPCNGQCTVIENGSVQAAGIISWNGSTTVDTINFASDVEAVGPTVPEPASLILLGSGLFLAGGFLRRRHLSVTP